MGQGPDRESCSHSPRAPLSPRSRLRRRAAVVGSAQTGAGAGRRWDRRRVRTGARAAGARALRPARVVALRHPGGRRTGPPRAARPAGLPAGTASAGRPARFQAAVHGAHRTLAMTLARNDRSCHGRAAAAADPSSRGSAARRRPRRSRPSAPGTARRWRAGRAGPGGPTGRSGRASGCAAAAPPGRRPGARRRSRRRPSSGSRLRPRRRG